jgi:hypothetical protein
VELEDWYLDRTWSKDYAVHRILDRYEFLRKTGRIARAYAELHMAKWLFPSIRDPELERQLAGITLDLESALRSSVEFGGLTWTLFNAAGAAAIVRRNDENQTLQVSVLAATSEHEQPVRLQGPRRSIQENDAVTVRFQMRSNQPSQAAVAIERLFEPEANYPFQHSFAVTSEWKEYAYRLAPAEPERDAILAFSFGQPGVEFDIKDVEFEVEPGNAASEE